MKALFELSSVAIGFSRDRVALDVNPAYARLFGYESPDELRGGNLLEQIAPDCRAEIADNIRRRAAGEGAPTTYETIGLRKDGSQFPFRATVSIVQTEEGPLTAVMIEDLSELRASEAKLKDALDFEQRLVAASPTGVLVYSEDGQCVAANPAVGALVGASPADLLKQNFRTTRSWKEAGMIPIAEQVLRAGVGQSMDVHVVTTFGREIWFSAHFGSFMKAGARYLLLQVVDITERARIEAALKRSELNLARAQRIAGIGSFNRNLRTGEGEWSEEAFRIVGVSPSDRSPPLDQFVSMVHPEDRERVRRAHAEASQGRKPEGIDFRLRRADGAEINCHAELDVVLDPDGTPLELVGAIQDVTASRRQQARIEELLEKEQRARHEAELANRAKDVFLATLSHELRTPLSSILTWAQMLRGGRLDEAKTKKGIEVIERSARLQVQLVSDLLDLSRITAGKLSIDIEPVMVGPIVEAVVDSFAEAALAKRLELTTELEPAVDACADTARLQQVLWNLLGNAVKFTPAGGTIVVRLRRVGDSVEITVSDDGIGIAPEFMPHIFDQFTQAESSPSRRYGGLGLGLALSSRLARLMGGALDAESAGPNQGATFTLTLPALPLSPVQAGPFPFVPAVERGPVDIERIGGMRILLVDDDVEFLRAAGDLFDSCGAVVATAAGADEAMASLASALPDLIISDIAMPERDGYALIREIRQLPAQSGGRTPAIALTAFAGTEEAVRALNAGFQAHLAKPVDTDQLLRVVSGFAERAARRSGDSAVDGP